MAEINRHTKIDELPEMCRVEEAAAFYDCGKGVVYEMVRTGQLASIRLGRLVRIPKSALVEMVVKK